MLSSQSKTRPSIIASTSLGMKNVSPSTLNNLSGRVSFSGIHANNQPVFPGTRCGAHAMDGKSAVPYAAASGEWCDRRKSLSVIRAPKGRWCIRAVVGGWDPTPTSRVVNWVSNDSSIGTVIWSCHFNFLPARTVSGQVMSRVCSGAPQSAASFSAKAFTGSCPVDARYALVADQVRK